MGRDRRIAIDPETFRRTKETIEEALTKDVVLIVGAAGIEKEEGKKLVGARLRKWRLDAGMSQEMAAVMSGLKMITLQRLERGESQLEFETLQRLCNLYGTDWRDIREESPRAADFSHVPPFAVVFHPKSPLTGDDHERIKRAIDAAMKPRPATRTK